MDETNETSERDKLSAFAGRTIKRAYGLEATDEESQWIVFEFEDGASFCVEAGTYGGVAQIKIDLEPPDEDWKKTAGQLLDATKRVGVEPVDLLVVLATERKAKNRKTEP